MNDKDKPAAYTATDADLPREMWPAEANIGDEKPRWNRFLETRLRILREARELGINGDVRADGDATSDEELFRAEVICPRLLEPGKTYLRDEENPPSARAANIATSSSFFMALD